MKILAYMALALALATTAASAQAPKRKGGAAAQTLTSVPANSWTVNNWYKQNVYYPSDNNIGDIKDVLVDRAGKCPSSKVLRQRAVQIKGGSGSSG